MTFKHVFEGDLNCLTELFNCSFSIIFNHIPPIFFKPEGIFFVAPALQILTLVGDGEDMFCNYLHVMVGVRKEGWLGDFCMKLYFS